MRNICLLLSLILMNYSGFTQEKSIEKGKVLRVGVVGLVHTHVHWILGREKLGDIEIVGIVEPNLELAERYMKQYGFPMDLHYTSIDKMLESVKPDAVTAFNTIYDHLEVVEKCAPLGIHVMVEKPLAVSLNHALKMKSLAEAYNIQLLTNYETSWYGSNYEAYRMLYDKKAIGPLKKMVFHHGHQGPIEIGCNVEFTSWLTDPKMNGGGALTDFACYGANLSTWLMKGEAPQSIYCTTKQIKKDLYPNVDDDATIIVDYENVQCIIQASWNWSHNRKDMELYGKHGYIIAKNGIDMEILEDEKKGPYDYKAEPLKQGFHDPFALFQQVVQEHHKLSAFDVSSLENNILVMKILEAAKMSNKQRRLVKWEEVNSIQVD